MTSIFTALRIVTSGSAKWLSHKRFEVRIFAVLIGWGIHFLLGGLAFYFAWQFHMLRHLHDLIDGMPLPQLKPSAMAWWLFAGMSWLFAVWGAFRCACLARDRMIGSVLLYWLGVEALSLVNWLDSGVPEDWIWEFLGAGLLTGIGVTLARQYVTHKNAAAPVAI